MFIDSTLLFIIQYFSQVMSNFITIMLSLGKWMAILGFVWSGVQAAASTLELQKMMISKCVTYGIFAICLAFYRPVVNGLIKFSSEMSRIASGDSINSVEQKFLEELEQRRTELEQNYDAVAASIAKNKKGKWESVKRFAKTKGTVSADEDISRSQEALKVRLNKKINSIKNLFNVWTDEEGNEQIKGLKLAFRDKEGNNMGFISPDAFLNLTFYAAELLMDNEMNFDVYTEANNITLTDSQEESDSAKDLMTRQEVLCGIDSGDIKIKLTNIPWGAFVRTGLCAIACVVLIISVIAGIIQYVMGLAEYFITTSVSIILLSLMFFDTLKDYTNKIVATLLAQTMKLVVLQIMMYFILYTFMEMVCNITEDASQFSFIQFGMMCLTGLLAFIFISHAPTMASTIMSGNPQMSMGEFVRGVAVAGGAAAGTAYGVQKSVSAIGKGVSGTARTGSMIATNTRNRMADNLARNGTANVFGSAIGGVKDTVSNGLGKALYGAEQREKAHMSKENLRQQYAILAQKETALNKPATRKKASRDAQNAASRSPSESPGDEAGKAE